MMTRDEILALEEGEELDNLVAEKVMGWHIETDKFDYAWWEGEDGHHGAGVSRSGRFEDDEDYHILHWHPSGSVLWAMDYVIEKLIELGYHIDLYRVPDRGKWECSLSKRLDAKDIVTGVDENAPVAICKASLLAMLEE